MNKKMYPAVSHTFYHCCPFDSFSRFHNHGSDRLAKILHNFSGDCLLTEFGFSTLFRIPKICKNYLFLYFHPSLLCYWLVSIIFCSLIVWHHLWALHVTTARWIMVVFIKEHLLDSDCQFLKTYLITPKK